MHFYTLLQCVQPYFQMISHPTIHPTIFEPLMLILLCLTIIQQSLLLFIWLLLTYVLLLIHCFSSSISAYYGAWSD